MSSSSQSNGSSRAATSTGSTSTQTANGGSAQQQPLDARFPVDSVWEITVAGAQSAADSSSEKKKIKGRIYCTDEASQSVVLQTALVHTTLASDFRIIHADCIRAVSRLPATDESEEVPPASGPLPVVSRKVLEDREKKAVRLAEDALRHINRKASAKGQMIFDKLLKACHEASWKGESILVLKQIQVDPPYGPEHCRIVGGAASGKQSLDDDSLERVKKIVAATASST